MSTTFVLPQLEAHSKKRFWRSWKWICLSCFAMTLLLQNWLPGLVVGLGYLAGIVIFTHFLYHAGRRVKDMLLWRVRNRIVGSFIFIGFIPLLLLIGAVFLLGYILMSQLAGSYLRSTLLDLQHELSWIAVDLENRLRAGEKGQGFREAAITLFQSRQKSFPRLAVRIVALQKNDSMDALQVYDPYSLVADLQRYPPGMELKDRSSLEGILRLEKSILLISIHRMAGKDGRLLEISAPLDEYLENRLADERGIYTTFLKSRPTRLHLKNGKAEVEVGDRPQVRDTQLEERINAMTARRNQDLRWKIFGSPATRINGWNLKSGKEESLAHALLAIPLEVLFTEYFAQYKSSSQFLLWTFYILIGFFLTAELLSVFIGAMISRRITQSVNDMYKGTLALQRGNLQHHIPLRRHDQLGLLAHSFNQMTGSITHLLEEVTEKKRLQQELEIAREVQSTLFPKILPRPRGLSLFGGCEAAETVSGDYYDFIVEDDARIHMVIGDISGKGISAALLMASLQAAMRNQLMTIKYNLPEEIERGLAEVMNQLNDQLYQNSPSEKYATLFIGRYDAELRQLCYCNAGHLPPMLIHNGSLQRLDVGGTVVGLLEKATFQSQTLQLRPGSILAIYTDGVTETVNENDEEYGEERLKEVLSVSRQLSPEKIYSRVIERVRQWQGNLKQNDDITLIVGKVE